MRPVPEIQFSDFITPAFDALTQQAQFVRRPSRVLASSAADVDAKFIRERLQPALQGADNAGRDAGRVPVHAHDRTERLEPERMREALQKFVPTVMMNDRLRNDGAE